MTFRMLFLAGLLLAPFAVSASAASLQPPLAGLAFLLGSWSGESGNVADSGGTSRGTSQITAETNGAVLLRRDHVELVDKAAKPAGSFDILMTIYADKGAVHADYFDGEHVIHYTSVQITPGSSVVFRSSAGNGPVFQLEYQLQGSDLAVAFGVTPPGQTASHLIASGKLHKRQ